MTDFVNANLLALFTFYLTATFILSTTLRLRQYRDIGRLCVDMPNRWPRVLDQIKNHSFMFGTWATLRPALFAIVLLTAQFICSRVIFPQANIKLVELWDEWWLVPLIAIVGGAMVGIDGYFLIRIGRLDRRETEKYLDEAEGWLKSWKSPVISVMTFGLVNPRRIVNKEVKKALEEGKGLLQSALWWVSVQAAVRVCFGLLLWLAWANHVPQGGG